MRIAPKWKKKGKTRKKRKDKKKKKEREEKRIIPYCTVLAAVSAGQLPKDQIAEILEIKFKSLNAQDIESAHH